MKLSKVVCTFEEKFAIRKFFNNKTIASFKLIYRASENEFSIQKFHQKCDGVANTLTVIWTEFDRKIGGFTPLKWDISNSYGVDNSKESFIFSLTHNDKFTLQNPEKAIYNGQSYGPIFGDGHDLLVYDKSNTSNSSYANICHSYHN